MAAAEGLAHSNLFVKSQLLSTADFDEAALTKIFSPFGHIDSCRLVIKPKHSIAFVRFSTIGEAEAALSLNNTQVNGYTLEVKLADADAGPPSAGAPAPGAPHLPPASLLAARLDAAVSALCAGRPMSPGSSRLLTRLTRCGPRSPAQALARLRRTTCTYAAWMRGGQRPICRVCSARTAM